MHGHQARNGSARISCADPHYVARIVDAVDPQPGDNLVEIGPGLAALTGGLVARAGHITAIEIDRDLAARLRTAFTPEQLTLHEADALEFDYAQLGPRLRVVGNLPYNISSPLLFHLAAHDALLADLHVMLQKEVVARMTAAPGTADYGRLTVMLQAKFRIVAAVRRAARRVPARAEGGVRPSRGSCRCTRDKPAIADEPLFARIVAAAFSQRRKTLRERGFSSLLSRDTGSRRHRPGARGETLAVARFVRLAEPAVGFDR